MNTIKTRDGAEIFFKDWGPKDAQPIVFHHGWPLCGDDWDAQMLFFLQHGYRVIAHDRRGHGRSSQISDGHDMDTYGADVAELAAALDLWDAIHIGHSTGGGEATRYVARYAKGRAGKLVLIGAVPPILLKSAANPNGTPIELFDGLRAGVAANRPGTYWDFTIPFYGYNRPATPPNDQVRQNWMRQAMMGAANAQYECIKAFSETDFTDDLKSIDVPVIILHGEDDQIVPIADSARIGIKLVKQGTLKTYPGFPHGMATTHADVINADLLDLIRPTPKKVVVIGGSGLIGSKLVKVLRDRGAEVVAASPQTGVNTLTGEGLAETLAGADIVVDVANSPSLDDQAAMDFFTTSGRNLLAAEARAGVKHHVALSIVGAQRMADSGYMRAKVAQEALVEASGLPYSILKSAQFFEFVERVVDGGLDGDVYRLSPALMQPIAADEVVAALADVALAAPINGVTEVAGPEAIPLDELGREVLTAHEDPRCVVADTHARYFGAELDDRSLIPGPKARLGAVKFADWLRQTVDAD